MKTKILILAALVIGIFFNTSINAGSGLEKENNETMLTQTFETLFQNAPLQDLMDYYEKCKINVKFRINANHEISNIRVAGNNSEMVNYVTMKLSQTPIKVNPSFEQKGYTISLYFILR